MKRHQSTLVPAVILLFLLILQTVPSVRAEFIKDFTGKDARELTGLTLQKGIVFFSIDYQASDKFNFCLSAGDSSFNLSQNLSGPLMGTVGIFVPAPGAYSLNIFGASGDWKVSVMQPLYREEPLPHTFYGSGKGASMLLKMKAGKHTIKGFATDKTGNTISGGIFDILGQGNNLAGNFYITLSPPEKDKPGEGITSVDIEKDGIYFMQVDTAPAGWTVVVE